MTSNRKFGVEIEAYGISRSVLAAALTAEGIQAVVEGYGHTTRSHWKLVTDGSLSAANSFELVSPVLQGQAGLEDLRKVCTVLLRNRVRVDRDCGLHVHVDANDLSATEMAMVALRYNFHGRQIDSFMPLSRRENRNNFCREMPQNEALSLVNTFNREINIRSLASGVDRYRKLNLAAYIRHGTVEFRQHSGSVMFSKISNWVKFCVGFVEESRRLVGVLARDAVPSTETPRIIGTRLTGHELRSFYNGMSSIMFCNPRYDHIECPTLSMAKNIAKSIRSGYANRFTARCYGKKVFVNKIETLTATASPNPTIIQSIQDLQNFLNTQNESLFSGVDQEIEDFYRNRAMEFAGETRPGQAQVDPATALTVAGWQVTSNA